MTILVLILLGLCFGSFVNALVWRLHQQETTKAKDLSILNGRSVCVHCRHTLGVWDLVPLLSWVFLGGRCRYCKQPVSWQYPAVELLTAILFVLSYLFWPRSGLTSGEPGEWGLFVVWLIILTGLVALLVYDIRWMLLPNRIVFPLMVVAALGVIIKAVWLNEGVNAISEALLGLIFCGGLFYLLYQVSGGRWIGGGDVKLGWLLGVIVGGPWNALLVIFIASFLGSVIGLGLMATKRIKSSHRIAFGPFLIVAAIIVQLFGTTLIESYKQAFLLV